MKTPFRTLQERVEKDSEDKGAKDLISLLYETALLTSGFTLEDPKQHASRIHRMIELNLDLESLEIDEPEETKPSDDAAASDEGKEDKGFWVTQDKMEEVD